MKLTGALALLLTSAAFAACSGGGATVAAAPPGPPGGGTVVRAVGDPSPTPGAAASSTPAPSAPSATPAPNTTPTQAPTVTPSPQPTATASPSPTPIPSPNPGPTVCPTIIISMMLVYPAPGSTGIPDDIGSVVIAGGAYSVSLQPATGPAVVSTTVVPVPSPMPSPSVAIPPGTYAQAIAFPTLAQKTTYVVTSTEHSACGFVDSRVLGSFTTQ
jgi:hypothetical protein